MNFVWLELEKTAADLTNCDCSNHRNLIFCSELTVVGRFVYGGLSDTEGGQRPSLDFFDVFLLPIPSFSWTRISSFVAQMRASHKCQVIGNRQMLVIGGHDPSSLQLAGNVD